VISTFFDVIAGVLAFFYSLYPSYGFAVGGLTLTVMLVVTPLTLKSTRSMLQMQRLQPEVKAIQNRHKGDRAAMNEEMMEFYKEHGINPLGGCLPLLVQLPIFLVLFRVVQGITRRVTGVGSQLGWTSGRLGSGSTRDTTSIASHERPFDPENLPADSEMYRDLVGEGLPFDERPTEMWSLGMDLSRSMQNVLGDGLVATLPYLVLIVLVLISSLYQQRQIRGRNKGAPINPQQEMIMKIIPYMLPVFSFTMPAALVVYFVISNLYRIGQQGYITHSLYKGEESLGAQAARSRAMSRGDSDDGQQPSKSSTPKKGQPTPRRDGGKTRAKAPARRTRASSRGSQSKASRGRVSQGKAAAGKAPSRPRNQTKTAGQGDKRAKSGSKGRASASKNSQGSKPAARPQATGAGRTGNAPSRFHRPAGSDNAQQGRAQPKRKQKKRQ